MPDTIDDAQEHPIIFNDWSITRILAGEKTQTRRVVKPQPPNEWKSNTYYSDCCVPFTQAGDVVGYGFCDANGREFRSPYGKPGDVLWVREAFRMPVGCDDKYTPKEYVSSSGYTQGMPGRFRYEADGKRAYEVAENRDACAVEWGRKRPSIHMPRELCRIRLRVEDVRVERACDISADDAFAEGVKPFGGPPHQPSTAKEAEQMQAEALVSAFRQKWNDIHGDEAWERNEWVWVIEFARYDE